MGLKREDDTPPRIGAARGRQGCRHLDRVMTIVINDREPPAFAGRESAPALEPSAHAPKRPERFANGIVIHAQFIGDRDRSEGIQYVMPTG